MESRSLDDLMHALAEKQHGVVGREQLRSRGVSRQVIAGRLRSPDWSAMTGRVLVLEGMPGSGEQRAMAAVLDAGAGAVVSHQSAAALWGVPGFHLEPLVLSRPRTGAKRRTAIATVHHPVTLPPDHITTRGGIPVTNLVRTVFDLAGVVHPARAERALQAALRLGLSWTTVDRHLVTQARQGRDGISVMRQLVVRHRGKAVLGSGLEARFLALLMAAGLPEARRQVQLGAQRSEGRVDFYYDDVRLVIEVNGNWSHSTSMDVEEDQHRTARLVAAGYTVLPVPERLIFSAPREVATLVREARSHLA